MKIETSSGTSPTETDRRTHDDQPSKTTEGRGWPTQHHRDNPLTHREGLVTNRRGSQGCIFGLCLKKCSRVFSHSSRPSRAVPSSNRRGTRGLASAPPGAHAPLRYARHTHEHMTCVAPPRRGCAQRARPQSISLPLHPPRSPARSPLPRSHRHYSPPPRSPPRARAHRGG